MRLGQVDFPERLMAALRDGELVVFAGAGVSMAPPAGLPDFVQLAERVANRIACPREEDEDPIAYLSRIRDQQINVHSMVAEILTQNDPKPNSLHNNLLRLYKRQPQPRIVTTNFDLLFEVAQPEPVVSHHTAPALPPGHRFQGIVHLHGTTNHPEDMVLTDADVSQAYLHEEWALTFLKQLFSRFTVLFIGYSHDDTMMQYLARGMPAQRDEDQQRFALTIEEERSRQRWGNRGITPITFPPDDEGGYANLALAIEALAEYITRQPAAWRQRIDQIAKRPHPPTDPEEEDIIKEALRDPGNKLRFFTEGATSPEWMNWLEHHHYLDRLFQPGPPQGPDRTLADWMANRFVTRQPEALKQLISRHSSTLSPYLWKRLSHEIQCQESPDGNSFTIRQWVSLLLSTAPTENRRLLSTGLSNLTGVCLREGLTQSLVSCFGQMCRMTLIIPRQSEHPASQSGPGETDRRTGELFDTQPPVELGTACPQGMLEQTWGKNEEPNCHERNRRTRARTSRPPTEEPSPDHDPVVHQHTGHQNGLPEKT